LLITKETEAKDVCGTSYRQISKKSRNSNRTQKKTLGEKTILGYNGPLKVALQAHTFCSDHMTIFYKL
jgi:hypothetical protein